MAEGCSFNNGDLVWAKMKGFSPWPGKISKPLKNMKKPKAKNPLHCVWFFGSNNYAWIEENCIKPYEEHRDKLKGLCNTSGFKAAVAAIEEYIARKEAGEDVDKEFEVDEGEEMEAEEGDMSAMNSSALDEEDGLSDGGQAVRTPPVPTPRKRKSLQENGESVKTPKKARKSQDAAAATPSSSKVGGSSTRKSAVSNLLDRPAISSKPDAAPLDVGNASETLKQKQIKPSNLTFGFLGLGHMGSGMVKQLINSNHKVIVWNRTPEKCKQFVDAGAEQGQTPSDVITLADITFSCVLDPQACKDMVFGNCGVLSEMDPTKGYVEMTGIDAETSKDIADAINSKGGRYLEAQIQGTKADAEDGSLIILSAGDRSLDEDCQSAFRAMSIKSYYLGEEVGNASKMNLVLQLIQAVGLIGLTEGMALADRANLQTKDVMELLSLTGFSSKMVKEKGNCIVEGNFDVQQTLQHVQKDLNLAIALGNQLDQPLHVAAMANEVFKHAKRLGYGEHDASAVYIRARF